MSITETRADVRVRAEPDRVGRIDAWTLAPAAVLLVALASRLWGLTRSSLTHPEMYIPGIPLIAGITEPPPRLGFFEAMRWHFYAEAHPIGYYLAMGAWTKVAGTGEFGLRFASVLLGVGTVGLVWLLARTIYDRKVAALAATLIALSGFQVFWSQVARAYVAGEFFAVLATVLLVLSLEERPRRRWIEAGYVAALVAGTQMLEQVWAVLFLHIAWAALTAKPSRASLSWRSVLIPSHGPRSRLLQVQAIALILALPEFVHLASLGKHRSEHEAAPRFLPEYLDFGFLFEKSDLSLAYQTVPTVIVCILAIIALALALVGLRTESAPLPGGETRPLRFGWLAGFAGVATALGLVLAVLVHRHVAVLSIVAALPLVCLWLPGAAGAVRPALERVLPGVARHITQDRRGPLLLAMLALLTPVACAVVGLHFEILVTRGFLPFTPFYLVLIAAGTLATFRPRFAALLATAELVGLFCVSLAHFHGWVAGPQDYRGVGQVIAANGQPGDVFMIRKRSWADTPLVYYVHGRPIVAEGYGDYVAAHSPGGVWLLHWEGDVVGSDRERDQVLAQAGYRVRAWYCLRGLRLDRLARGPGPVPVPGTCPNSEAGS